MLPKDINLRNFVRLARPYEIIFSGEGGSKQFFLSMAYGLIARPFFHGFVGHQIWLQAWFRDGKN